MRYINDPEFVKRMDDLVDSFSLIEQEDVEKFWSKWRQDVVDTYKDSDRWTGFYNVITGVIDDYDRE